MLCTRQGPLEGEPECSDAASRASSQQERPVGTDTSLTAEAFRQTMMQLQQHLILQQQQFLREVIERMNPAGREAPRATEDAPQMIAQVEEPLLEQQMRADIGERVSPVTVGSQRNSDNYMNANATKWLATQIPEFGGVDSDNVNVWTKRVDKVALIHGANDAVTLLAASSKLVKNARHWYDLQDEPSTESWVSLKQEITKMFDKKTFF